MARPIARSARASPIMLSVSCESANASCARRSPVAGSTASIRDSASTAANHSPRRSRPPKVLAASAGCRPVRQRLASVSQPKCAPGDESIEGIAKKGIAAFFRDHQGFMPAGDPVRILSCQYLNDCETGPRHDFSVLVSTGARDFQRPVYIREAGGVVAKPGLCNPAMDVGKKRFMLVLFAFQKWYRLIEHLQRFLEPALHEQHSAKHRFRQGCKFRILQLLS